MAEHDHDEITKAFQDAVNMTPKALADWLETDESKSVGWAGGEAKHDAAGPESVGHHEGRRIVEIKHKAKADYTEQDYADMKKVAAYVKRHLAQGGQGRRRAQPLALLADELGARPADGLNPQRVAASGCGTAAGGLSPGRATAYISQAMVLVSPWRSSPMR